MKTNDLRQRLSKDRPMTSITMRIPEDVVADLKRVAPRLGFTGYQPLIRAYIGQGLRADLARLPETDLATVADDVIEAVLTEAGSAHEAA